MDEKEDVDYICYIPLLTSDVSFWHHLLAAASHQTEASAAPGTTSFNYDCISHPPRDAACNL